MCQRVGIGFLNNRDSHQKVLKELHQKKEYGAFVFVVVRAASHEIYGYGVLRTSTKHGNSSSTQYDMQQANHVFFFLVGGGIYIYDHIYI